MKPQHYIVFNKSRIYGEYSIGKLYGKTCRSKMTKLGFQDRLSVHAGQKYYRML